jgi:mono/diheme cytochrome c family protein
VSKQSALLLLLTGLVVADHAAAQSGPAGPASRGRLLYETHCVACHSEQLHWRERKLVTDWASLKAQVRRWQGTAQLGWSEEDVVDVARHLNAIHYRLPQTGDVISLLQPHSGSASTAPDRR